MLGTSTADIGHFADIDVRNRTSFDELFCILKNSILHFDIDGACSHIAAALRTKTVVLFGPTDIENSAYPENINIASSLCGACWGMTACPLGYESLCMKTITPDFVAKKALCYLEPALQKVGVN